MSRFQQAAKFFSAFSLLTVATLCRGEAMLFNYSLEQLLTIKIESASKAPDSVRDIPASVTILTRDAIASMGYTTFEELLIHLPGFYHIDTYEDFKLGVRGTLGGSIAFLVNGVQQHPTRLKTLTVPDRSMTNIPIDSIDRIEIIRGPSSVIYGNNAFYGSINIVTNNRDEKANLVSVSAGTSGTGKLFTRFTQESDAGFSVFNLQLFANDGLGGALDEMLSESQWAAYHNPASGIAPGFVENLSGRMKMRRLSAEYSGEYRNWSQNFRYSSMRYGFYALLPGYDKGNQLELDSWHLNMVYEDAVNDAMNANLSVTASHEDYFLDPDFVEPHVRGYQQQASDRLEIEALLKGRRDGRLQWVAGLNMRRLDSVENNVDIEAINTYRLLESETITSGAIFANLRYAFSDEWMFHGGYRYTDIGAYDISTITKPEGSVRQATIRMPAQRDDAMRLALIWSIGETDMLKAIFGTATQTNNAQELTEPETIASYELNYLHTGRKNTLSLSAFDNDINKIRQRTLRLDSEGLDVDEFVNSANWRTQGIEVVATHRPNKRFSIELSGVYQRSEDQSIGGADIGFSPECQFKAKLAYGLGNWAYSAALVYVDSMNAAYKIDYTEEGSDYRVRYDGDAVSDYTLLTLNLRYQRQGQPWYINLHSFNTSDTEMRYPAHELAGFQHGAIGPERRVVLTWGADF